jgi:flagellar basal body rod protein FlgF
MQQQYPAIYQAMGGAVTLAGQVALDANNLVSWH